MRVVIALLVFASVSMADTIFNGFGTGDSWLTPRVVSVDNADVIFNGVVVAQDLDWAFAFTPTTTVQLTSIEIALSHVSDTNQVEIILRDESSLLPGTQLELWSRSGLSATGSIQTFTSVLSPTLNAGTRYWIEMSAGTEGSLAVAESGWHSSDGNSSPRARQYDEGAWSSSGSYAYAYRVNGDPVSDPVPEPGTFVLFGMAALGYGVYRRCRKAS